MTSHNHHPGHQHGITSTEQEGRAIGVAFWLNFSFTLIEFIGGILVNSVAIMADAVHDLGDTLAIGMGWLLGKISGRPADLRYRYGYRRLAVLAAVINALVLIVGSVIVISLALPRLWAPQMPDAGGMLWLALLGVVVNGIAAWRLRQQGSINAGVIRWHLLEDVLGWLAVLIVSLVLLVWEVPILDPLLSIGFTLFILVNVLRNLRQALRILLQAAPDGVPLDALETALLALPGAAQVHQLNAWSLDGERHVFSAHLRLADHLDSAAIGTLKQRIQGLLADYEFVSSTVELEWPGEPCRDQSGQG